jgi:plastocyanin domain-containing protein
MDGATEAGVDEEKFQRIKQFIVVLTIVNLLGAGGVALFVLV